MNIEIANRLVQLRKKNNLSQEALAEKLGISRQAVSKWERAEASPDTDNLILLARLYQVSLDELLRTEDEILVPSYIEENEAVPKSEDGNCSEEDDYVHVGFNGIHVKDKEGDVHIGWNGIHVEDEKSGNVVSVDQNGVFVNGERKDKEWFSHHAHFPIFMVMLIVYFVISVIWNAWHPGWLLFLLVPIWYSLAEAIRKRDANRFAYPILATLVFLCLGIFKSLWHPGWGVYLTVPLYYGMISYFRGCRWKNRAEEEMGNADEE